MNKKEQFARAYEIFKGLSAQVDGRRKILSEHSPETRAEDADIILSTKAKESATRKLSDSAPADKKTKYEQFTATYKNIRLWLYLNEKNRFVVAYNQARIGKPIMFKTELFDYIPKIPYGHTLNSLLEKYADIHPDMVVQDANTGDFYLRKIALGSFMGFANDFISKRKEQIQNSLTADAILQKYLFTKNISEGSLDKKIREFAKQNPAAVIPTSKAVPKTDGNMRSKKIYAVGRSYLQDFFKYAGLTIVDSPVVETATQPTQPKIDPSAPGYQTDPTLQSLSDQEMDAIASRLSGQNITDADDANDAIFAEMKRIADSRDNR